MFRSLNSVSIPARLRFELAAMDMEVKLLRLRTKAGFDPNQPRVPAGDPDGGQWTGVGGVSGQGSGGGQVAGRGRGRGASSVGSGNSRIVRDSTGQQPWRSHVTRYRDDGSVASRTVHNRDGSKIVSEFEGGGRRAGRAERNTVALPDGSRFTFENRSTTQRIYDGKGRLLSEAVWTPNGPELQPIVQQAFADPRKAAVEKLLQAGIALYTWWLSSKEPGKDVVFAFNANEYRPDETLGEPPVWVGKRTREEVEEACRKLGTVQSFTDEASRSLNRAHFKDAQTYGTAVHKEVKIKVNGGDGEPRDPDFRAEVSFLKWREETGDWAGKVERYGLKDTIRVDVLERRSDDVVCVYDIKTGKSGLSTRRAREIFHNVSVTFPGTRRILVTEVRPTR
jgi:hypothetical protein